MQSFYIKILPHLLPSQWHWQSLAPGHNPDLLQQLLALGYQKLLLLGPKILKNKNGDIVHAHKIEEAILIALFPSKQAQLIQPGILIISHIVLY